VPAWSQADEKKYLDLLIAELNEKLLAGLDPEPNLSRSSKRPAMYPAVRSSCIENIVFVGGSNARALSSAAASLGANSYNIAKDGWKITRENVDKLIPDLKEIMSSLRQAHQSFCSAWTIQAFWQPLKKGVSFLSPNVWRRTTATT
jgi:hypothetical protein